MIPFIRLLLAILLDALLLLLARLLSRSIAMAQLLPSVFAFLSQVWELLHFGLVEAVDDGVQSLLNVYSLDLFDGKR